MIKNLVRALPVICLAAAALPAAAQSASGSGSITVIRPLTVTKNRDMAFGTIVRPTSGTGSVVLTAAASTARSTTGGAVALASTTATSAQFTLDGEGAQLVSVVIPAEFNMTSGGNTLTVTTSNNLTNAGAVALDGSLGGAGSTVFYVGGSIPIANDTATGTYNGSFTVTASYN